MSRRARIGKKEDIDLTGGPWNGLQLTIRPGQRSAYGDYSLPVRIGAFYGRYNPATGQWVALEMTA